MFAPLLSCTGRLIAGVQFSAYSFKMCHFSRYSSGTISLFENGTFAGLPLSTQYNPKALSSITF